MNLLIGTDYMEAHSCRHVERARQRHLSHAFSLLGGMIAGSLAHPQSVDHRGFLRRVRGEVIVLPIGETRGRPSRRRRRRHCRALSGARRRSRGLRARGLRGHGPDDRRRIRSGLRDPRSEGARGLERPGTGAGLSHHPPPVFGLSLNDPC